jgi:hypothetical protein
MLLPSLSSFDDLSLTGSGETGKSPYSPLKTRMNFFGLNGVLVSGLSRYQTYVEFHPHWLFS